MSSLVLSTRNTVSTHYHHSVVLGSRSTATLNLARQRRAAVDGLLGLMLPPEEQRTYEQAFLRFHNGKPPRRMSLHPLNDFQLLPVQRDFLVNDRLPCMDYLQALTDTLRERNGSIAFSLDELDIDREIQNAGRLGSREAIQEATPKDLYQAGLTPAGFALARVMGGQAQGLSLTFHGHEGRPLPASEVWALYTKMMNSPSDSSALAAWRQMVGNPNGFC